MKMRRSNIYLALPCALIVLAALAGGFLPPLLEGNFHSASLASSLQAKLYFVAVCTLTAATEESIFRFALMRGAVHLGCSWRRAAFISATLFGLAHLGLPAEGLLGSSIAWAQCALKVLQGAAFGYTLAVMYAQVRKLWVCILVHFTFDALYFAPYFSTYQSFPATYTTGVTGDLAGLAVSLVLLTAAAVIAWVSWRQA